MQHINLYTIDEKISVCFDTGLDPRAFARTKMSQSLIETGIVSYPNGTQEKWRPAGVYEVNGLMRVWGPLFPSQRLDLLLEKATESVQTASKQEAQQAALRAVAFWIRAKMLLGDTRSIANPAAAFFSSNAQGQKSSTQNQQAGVFFFAPEHLSTRCLFIEGTEIDRYNCPDLTGMDTAAFCAGLMLYLLLTGVHPYPAATIFQDMREGVFLPPHLAAAGLDKKTSELIHAALLLPVEKKRTTKSGADILAGFLEILMDKENNVINISSLFNTLTTEESTRFEKETKLYLFKQNTTVKIKRFAARNKYAIIGVAVVLLFVLFIFISTTNSFSSRPTTAGMASDTVISAYYDAFSSLDHMFMEACVNGAGKADINAAISLYAIVKTREAYENSNTPTIIPARVWRENGGELPSHNTFGVTDLNITYLAGDEEDDMIIYRTEYLLWSPTEDYSTKRSDVITLRRDRRKNWRITEMLRTEF